MTAVILERNQDATIYVGGLDEKVTEAILWELFVNSGPVTSVNMPKDRITGTHQGFGFIEFMSEEDADYAIKIMNMIKLFGKPIKVNKASANEKQMDVGANLFVGNLAAEVDEKLLFDTFSAFGVILQPPKIMRDVESGSSKGFAFINFASFEASDAALEAMNGQFLCNRPITCSYAFKKDTKGERHGTAAERLLASQNPLFLHDRPHQIFSDVPGLRPMPIPPPAPPSVPQGLPPMPPGMMPPPPPMHISPAGMAMGFIPHSGIGLPPMPPMQHIPRPPPPPMGMGGGPHMFPPPPPPPMSRQNIPPPPPPPSQPPTPMSTPNPPPPPPISAPPPPPLFFNQLK